MSESPSMLGEAQAAPTGEAFHRPDESVDTSLPDVKVEDFDAGAFLAGVRSTRRSVQVVERGDLVGDMERLAHQYADADEADDDAACERIAAEFDKVAAQFHASKRWFTAEKRSGEWVDGFREDVATRLGLDVGDPRANTKDAKEIEARTLVTLHQVAAQIVSPKGVTVEHLQALYEANEGELNKLIAAVAAANRQTASAAKVATPGFSLRRSDSKGTAGSKRR